MEDGFVKRPRSRRANLAERGVLEVRRSDSEMKRNAEIGFSTKPSRLAGGALELSDPGGEDLGQIRSGDVLLDQTLEGAADDHAVA